MFDNFTADIFDAAYWQNKNAVLGTAKGRGITYFVAHNNNEWILKHYYRGGLIGKLIRDKYIFTGFENTRAAKEFQLMKTMEALSLPAPKAIAFRIQKRGLSYQADMLTERIAQARDLVTILTEKTLNKEIWRKIGVCIKRFHHHGIYHHDLNIHNILMDANEKIWLIDFDCGEQRKPKKSWQQDNLKRLLRSFNKENKKLPVFNWQTEYWELLMEGYLSS